MLEKLLNYLENKKILILGFGLEGKSTYRFLREKFPEKQIVIYDGKSEYAEQLKEDSFVKFISGDEYLNEINEVDIAIKTPGMSLKNVDTSTFEDKITSELDLLLEYVDVFTIGVTGTKGKSTTSSLINEILVKNGKKSILLGNIGVPIFEEIEQIEKDTIVVLELSSHALQYVKKSPNIAILLNLYQEHLDHYKSFEEYRDAKYNIFKYQTENDYALYNIDNEYIIKNPIQTKAKKFPISMKESNDIELKKNEVYYKNKLIYKDEQKRHILGTHNLNNILFALAVSCILGLDCDTTKDAIDSFLPLEHRMEYVGNFGEIEYYNDSIATIPESTISAIETLKNVNTLIVGGKDRGINLEDFIKYLDNSKVENIICLPKTGEYIFEKLKNKSKYLVKTMEEAVRIAKEKTKKSTICLLSPAASSYGFFEDYRERGKIYKMLVSKK